MRISESQIREILRKIILEVDVDADGEGGRVVFASRSLMGTPSHHSWVIIYPASGGYITLSGKAGAAFTAHRLLKGLAIGRSAAPDEYYFAAKKKWEEGGFTAEEWNEILQLSDWNELQKMRNWSSDTPGSAEVKINIPPPEGVSMSEFQKRIMNGFKAYAEDIPYDPLPGISDNPADRNSNSFAFSLIRAGYQGGLPDELQGFRVYKYPGSRDKILQIIQGWRGIESQRRLMQIVRGNEEDLSNAEQEREREQTGMNQQPTSESLSRDSLKNIILDVMLEGDVVDLEKYRQSKQPDPDQEWFDLFDEEELQKYKTRGRLRQQTADDPGRDASEDETFEEYLQGIESGKVVDMFQDDDPISEVKSDGAAYTGTLGTAQQVPTADDAGAAADKCQIDRDEIENVTNQYNTEEDQQQKKAYQDQLRVLTQNHNKSKSQGGCGP